MCSSSTRGLRTHFFFLHFHRVPALLLDPDPDQFFRQISPPYVLAESIRRRLIGCSLPVPIMVLRVSAVKQSNVRYPQGAAVCRSAATSYRSKSCGWTKVHIRAWMDDVENCMQYKLAYTDTEETLLWRRAIIGNGRRATTTVDGTGQILFRPTDKYG